MEAELYFPSTCFCQFGLGISNIFLFFGLRNFKQVNSPRDESKHLIGLIGLTLERTPICVPIESPMGLCTPCKKRVQLICIINIK